MADIILTVTGTARGQYDHGAVVLGHCDLYGLVDGDLTVPSGCSLELHGMVCHDLIVEPGGTATVRGMVNGTIVNNDAVVELFGTAGGVGDIGSTKTVIHAGAKVGP